MRQCGEMLWILVLFRLCLGLTIRREGWQDARSVWSRPFGWDSLIVVIGALDLAKSGGWLVDLLRSSEYPFGEVYFRAYANGRLNLSWNRLEDILRFQAKHGEGIEELLPVSMLTGAMIRWRSMALELAQRHPGLALQSPSLDNRLPIVAGGSGDSRLPKAVIPVELSKVARAPLRVLADCRWAYNAFASVGIAYMTEANVQEDAADWILNRIHPLCILDVLEREGSGPFSAILQPLLMTRVHAAERAPKRSVEARWMRLAIHLGLVQLLTYPMGPLNLRLAMDCRRENYRATVDVKLVLLADSVKTAMAQRRRQDPEKEEMETLGLIYRLLGAIQHRLSSLKHNRGPRKGPVDCSLLEMLQIAGLDSLLDPAWQVHWAISIAYLLVQLGGPAKGVLDDLAIGVLQHHDMSQVWPLDLRLLHLLIEQNLQTEPIKALAHLLDGAHLNEAYAKRLLDELLWDAFEKDDVPGLFQFEDFDLLHQQLVMAVPLRNRLAFLRHHFGLFDRASALAIFIAKASKRLRLEPPSDHWRSTDLLRGLFDRLRSRGLIGVRRQGFTEACLLGRNDMKILGFSLALNILYGAQRVPLQPPLSPLQIKMITGRAPKHLVRISQTSVEPSSAPSCCGPVCWIGRNRQNPLHVYFPARGSPKDAEECIRVAIGLFRGVLPLAEILSLDELISLLT